MIQFRGASRHYELWKASNLHLLKLQGTAAQRIEAHGSLIGRELSDATLRYFAGKIREPLSHLPWYVSKPARASVNQIVRKFIRQLPSELAAELDLMMQHFPLEREDLLTALVTPDLGCLAFSWLKYNWAVKLKMMFGCTTIASPTADRGFVLARNLDFPGLGAFDAHPNITVQMPTEPGQLARAAIGSDGVHFASISAINEAGIGLVVHQNFSLAPSPRGLPLMLIGDYILRSARSLDQAVEILEKYHPGPLWTFVLFDLSRGETVACESSHQFSVQRSSEGSELCQSNHCLTDAGRALELTQFGTFQNSVLRYQRAQEAAKRIRELSGAEAVREAAKTLAFQSSEGPPTISNDIIKPYTIQSVIFHRTRPDTLNDAQLWVSDEAAPTSSGQFVRIHIEDLFNSSNQQGRWSGHPLSRAYLSNTNPTQRKDQMRLASACAASFDRDDDAAALRLLGDMSGFGMELVRATLAYRVKEFQLAKQAAKRGLGLQPPPYIEESLLWILIVSLVQLQKNGEASSVAEELVGKPRQNPDLQKRAQRFLRKGSLSRSDRGLIFDWFSGDLWSRPLRGLS